jgi:small GTP-binding protein
MNNDVQKLIKEALDQQKAFDEATVKCGIVGLSGSGKSSLINAIAGEVVAPVSSTEQTMEALSFFHSDIEFVDLPGCGTEKWPQSTYISDLELDEYDCFIIVTSNRLYESDIYLYEEMAIKRDKPCFIIRNKIDLAIVDELHDNNLSEDETIAKIKTNILSGINSINGEVYLTSTRHPAKYDFPRLLNDIASSQHGVKRDKFVAGMAVWSEKALCDKRKVAESIVSWSSVKSAANGLNPIPGLDVSIDVGVLIHMVREINKIFGLTEEQLKYAEKNSSSLLESPTYNGLKQGILKLIVKYAAVEGVIVILKRMGTKVAVKNVSKFLPFVGQLISAAIGYKMTVAFGEAYIDEVEEKAASLLEEVLKHS